MTSIAGPVFVFASTADAAPSVGDLIDALARRGVTRKALFAVPEPTATYATARCDALDPDGALLPTERGFETRVLFVPANTRTPVLLRDAPFDLTLSFRREVLARDQHDYVEAVGSGSWPSADEIRAAASIAPMSPVFDHDVIRSVLSALEELFPNGIAFLNHRPRVVATRSLSRADMFVLTGLHPPPGTA